MKVFNETQRFTQTWLIILLGISALIPIAILGKEYTNGNITDIKFISASGIILIAVLPVFFFKLVTRIDEKGIHYRFFPFHLSAKTILWSEIKSAYVRTYSPISEYGGWGIKGGFSRKKGKAINVKGDIGIQLELINSKKLLVGTQKKSEATRVLETYKHKLGTQ